MPIEGFNCNIEQKLYENGKKRKKIHDEFRKVIENGEGKNHDVTCSIQYSTKRMARGSSSDSQDKIRVLANELTRPGVVTRSRDQKQMQLLEDVDKVAKDWEFLNTLRLEAADKSVQLAHILEKAKPVLPVAAKSLLDQLKGIEKDIQDGRRNPLSGDQYVELIKNTIQVLSPETMRDYKDRNVAFAHTEENIYWVRISLNDRDQVQLEIPIQYEKPVHHMLCAIERYLPIAHMQDKIVPSPERRAEIHARVFAVNEMLGSYGWNIRGYELAKMYHKNYYNGVREAFEQNMINISTQESILREIGHKNARQKLIESVSSKPGEPKVFASCSPASYFMERLIAIKKGYKPVELGTEEFNRLNEKLQMRKQQGKDFSVIINIMSNGEVWVLPSFASKDSRPQHSINTRGYHCSFAGQGLIDGKELLRLDDKSGHFRPVDENADDPLQVLKWAVKRIEAKGFDISRVQIEKATLYSRDLEYYP